MKRDCSVISDGTGDAFMSPKFEITLEGDVPKYCNKGPPDVASGKFGCIRSEAFNKEGVDIVAVFNGAGDKLYPDDGII